MLELMTSSILKKLNEPGLEINPEVFQKLMANDGAAYDQFGISFDITDDGLTVVVGAPSDDDKGDNSGSAYIFTKQANGSYLQTQKLLASDGVTIDYFGSSVAISGDGSTVIVSAPSDDDKGKDSGSVYVFTKQANGTYLRTQKLVASDGVTFDFFGYRISISKDGTIIIVGTPSDDDKGEDSGSVYVFKKQVNGSYLQAQKLVASDGAANDGFGTAIAISRDNSVIVVGAHYDDDKGKDSGSVYVYTKQTNGTYLQTHKRTASDGVTNDEFGTSVALSGNGSVIVVGSPYDDDKGSNSGSVYIFTKQANGSYLQVQKLVPSDGAASDQFGNSVAITGDGSVIVIGSLGDDDKASNSGSVYIFTKQANESYLQTQKLTASDGMANDYLGRSIAISNTSVVTGAYNHLTKGAVYVY